MPNTQTDRQKSRHPSPHSHTYTHTVTGTFNFYEDLNEKSKCSLRVGRKFRQNSLVHCELLEEIPKLLNFGQIFASEILFNTYGGCGGCGGFGEFAVALFDVLERSGGREQCW